MKKMINGKVESTKRKIMFVIVALIFLLYFCLVMVLSNRKYTFIEKVFKEASSYVNTFFIDNSYSKYQYSNNVVNSKIKYLQKENSKLKEALELKSANVNYVTTQVVNHNTKSWFNTIGINKGYKSNIKKDDPVISSDGLIGFISKTTNNTSEVKLLTTVNENDMLSVLIETESGPVAGLLSDYDAKKRLFKITSVTSKNEILAGNSVVLSGYDKENYKGIYVGRVVKEETCTDGL